MHDKDARKIENDVFDTRAVEVRDEINLQKNNKKSSSSYESNLNQSEISRKRDLAKISTEKLLLNINIG